LWLRSPIVVAAAVCFFTSAAFPQTLLESDHVEVRFESCFLRASLLTDAVARRSTLVRDYSFFHHTGLSAGNYLSAYPARYYGLEKYELSPTMMVLLGAGVGAQAGMFLGAVGNTLGVWNEKTTWAMVGALSAMGAAFFGAKADEPEWRNVYLWEDDHRLVPVKR
jgi:hypothetical protein